MTREECAAELFHLIVRRGRQVAPDVVFGETYYDLPDFMQQMWLDKADQFAKESRFTFTD